MTNYITHAQALDYLNIPDDNDDPMVAAALTAASREIDTFCGRQFYSYGTSATAREFTPLSMNFCYIDDCQSITIVATDDGDSGSYSTTWAASDYMAAPVNQLGPSMQAGWPYTRLVAVEGLVFPCAARPSVQVTAVWGWADVPAEVEQACRILTAKIFGLKDARFGVATFSDLGLVTVRDLPEVATLLKDFRKYGAAGAPMVA